ncbi:hypothetical protein K8U54_18015 [Pseudomonas fulva]|uniref:exonuclease domain-containing protein n=1 Tax=Pseudomonas fulva TaxID=47880 RepID=UPI00201D6A8F|nr:exonuclease domain-containing protein [Pseudomonas fulva]UQY33598.1 hypothetical protein K8U54_18015 [Pseudomonas fulva]
MNSKGFLSIDVETANSWLGSICQIGIVEFDEHGEITAEWSSLVDPEEDFDEFNVFLHGISSDSVRGAPTFPEVIRDVWSRASGKLLTCYGNFDFAAFGRACHRHSIEIPNDLTWLNLHQVVRRAWPEKYGKIGYNLANVCRDFKIPLDKHHDALCDARAAGYVYLHALFDSGLDNHGWLAKVKDRISIKPDDPIHDVNADGPLYGERVAFTGALSITRSEAGSLAAQAGCAVEKGVTKHTTLLVMGDQDIWRLNETGKSSKHLKAEKLIAEGKPLRIVAETDFKELIKLAKLIY